MFTSKQYFAINPSGIKVPLRVDANGNLLVAYGA